jgi:outer membrane lipoprotein LolB
VIALLRRTAPRSQALALCMLLIVSCARQPLRAPTEWSAHLAEVASRSNWQLQGKIGLRAESRAGSAFLSWRQQHSDYRLVLSGALGLGKLVINGNPGGVSWVDSSGRERHFDDPQALIAEAWGWQVPVASLQYWVRGIPDPSSETTNDQFENGLATRFRQAGWTILPGAYEEVDGIEMPTRVRLESSSAILTVSISRWDWAAP